jgi:hypothetical protein
VELDGPLEDVEADKGTQQTSPGHAAISRCYVSARRGNRSIPSGRTVGTSAYLAAVTGRVQMSTYTLADAEARAKTNPTTFLIPPAVARYNLVEGNTVKLVFLGPEGTAERMWVSVQGRAANGQYLGKLDNIPKAISGLMLGDSIEFSPCNVIAIYDGKTPGDRPKSA